MGSTAFAMKQTGGGFKPFVKSGKDELKL